MRKKVKNTINPDEVFIDAFNLPSFDRSQFEGRVIRPINRIATSILGLFFIFIVIVFLYRAWYLQVSRGNEFAALSESNRLEHNIVFAKRGVIYDRYKEELVWNVPNDSEFSKRKHTNKSGFSYLLGFVGYPKKDEAGNWWRDKYVGKSGVEYSFDDVLSGKNGLLIVEVDATKDIQSTNVLRSPERGNNLELTVDASMQDAAYDMLEYSVHSAGYIGGAMVVLDTESGEVLTLTSYPEFSSEVMADGEDKTKIESYTNSTRKPFLNRAISAVYAPGSIIKPYVAVAALAEGIISQWKQILSSGVLTIPNPYYPDKPSHFLDWKAHGLVDMRTAIAVSSNIYFYAIGGGLTADLGLGTQEGLGIDKLAAYAQRFGFGESTGIELKGEVDGNVPTKLWKSKMFDEDWLLGNTYHSSIGQYGWLVTPLQACTYIAALANGGTLFTPQLLLDVQAESRSVGISDEYLQIVREGMRQAVTNGTLSALNYGDLEIAAKTGTAQVGSNNEYKNSWVVGFWPASEPKFAFAIVLESAPESIDYGAVNTSIDFFNWLRQNEPDYAQGKYPE